MARIAITFFIASDFRFTNFYLKIGCVGGWFQPIIGQVDIMEAGLDVGKLEWLNGH
jgi:hypothetical protein